MAISGSDMEDDLSSGTTLAIPCLDDGALNRCTGSGEAAGSKLPSATGFTLHLPLPPSVNTFQRDSRGRPLGNRSKNVKDWIRQADVALMLIRPLPKKVSGTFIATFCWDHRVFGKRDGDNMVKPVFDWLQRIELIDDDKKCFGFSVRFGDAPAGCIIRIEPVEDFL